MLPDSGLIYFFLDWRIMEGNYYRQTPVAGLVHYRADRGSELMKVAPPPDLPPCYVPDASFHYKWIRPTARSPRDYPRCFPRWDVTPFVVRSYADEHPHEQDGRSAGRYQQLWREAQLAAFLEAAGPAVERNYFVVPKEIKERSYLSKAKTGDAVWRPHPLFPESWLSVEIFAGMLCKVVSENIRYPDRSQKPQRFGQEAWPADMERLLAGYRSVLAQAEEWLDRSRRQDLFSTPSERDRQEFWRWCAATDRAAEDRIYDKRSAYTLNDCTAEAYRRGPDYCLSHSAAAAALVPDEIREALRWKHTVVVSGFGGGIRRHQMLGAGTSIQGAPERFRASHLLLMQFDMDPGMDWRWGDCGVLQYWIESDELRERRFDRVIVTMECG
jgi:hypothetical protein